MRIYVYFHTLYNGQVGLNFSNIYHFFVVKTAKAFCLSAFEIHSTLSILTVTQCQWWWTFQSLSGFHACALLLCALLSNILLLGWCWGPDWPADRQGSALLLQSPYHSLPLLPYAQAELEKSFLLSTLEPEECPSLTLPSLQSLIKDFWNIICHTWNFLKIQIETPTIVNQCTKWYIF